jgi:hypothetical protein
MSPPPQARWWAGRRAMYSVPTYLQPAAAVPLPQRRQPIPCGQTWPFEKGSSRSGRADHDAVALDLEGEAAAGLAERAGPEDKLGGHRVCEP